MKPRTQIRMALVVTLLLLALTATAALAAGLFQGVVGWDGMPQDEEVIGTTAARVASTATLPPQVTAAPHRAMTPAEIMAILHEEAARAGSDLVLIAEADSDPANTLTHRRMTTERSMPVADYAALTALLEGSLLPLPAALPEGYRATELRVSLDCRAEGAYTPIASWERDGLVITRYQASREHDLITSYTLSLEDAAGETLSIQARLHQDTSDMGFGLWDDDTARAVSIPGMENALLVERSGSAELFLRRRLPEPIPVLSLLYPDVPEEEPTVLSDLTIRISASALEGDALTAPFTP